MKIVFAADGSESTLKATEFLVRHHLLTGDDNDLLVLNVQPRRAAARRAAGRLGSGRWLLPG